MKIHFIYDKCSTPLFYNHGPQTHLLKQFMEFKAMLDFQCDNVSVASHLLHRFSYHALPILISLSSNVLRDMTIRSFEFVYYVIQSFLLHQWFYAFCNEEPLSQQTFFLLQEWFYAFFNEEPSSQQIGDLPKFSEEL